MQGVGWGVWLFGDGGAPHATQRHSGLRPRVTQNTGDLRGSDGTQALRPPIRDRARGAPNRLEAAARPASLNQEDGAGSENVWAVGEVTGA